MGSSSTIAAIPETTANRDRRWITSLFVLLLIAVHLAPIWAVPRFPSQDGPEHAYNATILHDYSRPAGAAFRQYFVISNRPVPNWTTHLILDAFLYVTSPVVADKLVVSGYVALFFLAGLYAVRSGGGPGRWPLLLMVPFVYNVFLFYGFYNFDYSLPVLITVIGFWLRHAERLRGRHVAMLTVLVTILYFCHIVSFGIAAILITVGVAQGILGLAATGPLVAASIAFAGITALRAFGGNAVAVVASIITISIAVVYFRSRPTNVDWAGARQRLIPSATPLIAIVPAAGFSAGFVAHEPSTVASTTAAFTRLSKLINWSEAFHSGDRRASIMVMIVFALATVAILLSKARRGAWRRGDAVFATAMIAAGLTMAMPNALAGGLYIVDRLGLLAAMVLGLWVALQLEEGANRIVAWRGRSVAIVVAVIAGVLLARDAVSMQRRAACIDELVTTASAAIPSGAAVLAMEYDEGDTAPGDRWRQPPVKFLPHAICWVAADRHAVQVDNYEAGTGFFPILFRQGYAYYTGTTANVVPSDYIRATGGRGRVDYVVLWTGGRRPQSPIDFRCAAELSSDFHEIARSPGRGWATVYARNTPGAPAR